MAGEDQNIATSGLQGSQLSNESQEATTIATEEAAAKPTLSSQIMQDASQANITNQDLFPGMNQNINVGSSSSQTLGSQPIFVPAGQYVPYNILNKKEEAIATAAKKRSERRAKFDPGQAKQLNNQLYQRKLNDRFNKMNSDFITTAQKMDPDNWDTMLNNPGTEIGKAYAQQKSNFEVLATESNVVFDKAANVIANKEKGGDTVHSAETKALAEEVQNRTGNAAEGGLEDLRPFVDKFNGSFDLDSFIAKNKFVTQMKADITATMQAQNGGLTVEQTEDYTKRIEQLAESETATNAGRYFEDDIIKKEDIVERLGASLGLKQTLSHKFKPAAPARFGKKIDIKDKTQKRYNVLKQSILNPSSEEGQGAVGGIVGNKYSNGIVTGSKYSTPEDYDSQRQAGDSLTGLFNDKKGKTTGFIFKDNVFEAEAVERFNAERESLGLKADVTSVKIDKDNKDFIVIKDEKGKSNRIDMTKEGAIEDYLIGKEAAKHKNETTIKVDYEKGGRIKTAYLSLDDPATFELLNTSLNSDLGEDLKVDQADLRELKKKDSDWGGSSGGEKKVSFDDYKTTSDYEARAKKIRVKYPDADPKQIEAFIKSKY